MEEVRENVEVEKKFEVDEKKAEEALLYIREVCNHFDCCNDCVFGDLNENCCTCMLLKGTRPDKWKLMCDGNKGKLFR